MSLIHNGIPSWVHYGVNALKELSASGEKKAFLISDENLSRTEMFQTALTILAPAEVYLLPTGEPKISDAQRALDAFRKCGVECVIGLGGGSVLDVAKTVAVLGQSDSTVKESIGNQLLTRQVELLLVPTTAGTGSEATRNCLFIDDQTGVKCALIADACLPDSVVLDPVLTRSLPPAIAAFTGVDALCHCVESYISRNHSPISRIWSLAGIERIREWLPQTIGRREDDEARQQMLFASFFGGVALAYAGTTAVHALAYSLGKRGVPHGVANSLLFEPVMRATLKKPQEQIPYFSELCAMIHRLPIPTLDRYAVRLEDAPAMAAEAMNQTRLLRNHPVEVQEDMAREIFEGLFQ